MLVDGSTTSKDDQRVRSYGDIDELNACIGLLRTSLRSAGKQPTPDQNDAYEQFHAQVDAELGRIQQELFNLGSELATPNFVADEKRPCVLARHIDRLESEIDTHNKTLAPLPSFILPGGGPCASFAHLARTVCRRAEREMVALSGQSSIRPETLRYVNRLSDYLFVVSRSITAIQGYEEVLWAPKDT